MLRFDFYARHADAVSQNLRAAASVSERRLVNATYDWAQGRVVRKLAVKPYPAKRPNQRYKRTYRLQAGWTADPAQGGARIYNRQPYAGHVVGDAGGRGQAWMHVGRWWLARSEIEAERPALREALVREMDRQL